MTGSGLATIAWRRGALVGVGEDEFTSRGLSAPGASFVSRQISNDVDRCTLRVTNAGHASDFGNIHGRHLHRPAERLASGQRRVDIIDGDIAIPGRRHGLDRIRPSHHASHGGFAENMEWHDLLFCGLLWNFLERQFCEPYYRQFIHDVWFECGRDQGGVGAESCGQRGWQIGVVAMGCAIQWNGNDNNSRQQF